MQRPHSAGLDLAVGGVEELHQRRDSTGLPHTMPPTVLQAEGI